MGKRIRSLASAAAIFSLFVSGCGIIGGAFEEPSPGEGNPSPQGATSTRALSTAAAGTPSASPTTAFGLPADCMQADDVTLDQVGQTICVGGQVFVAYEDHGTFIVDFNQARGGFYMLGRDWDTYDPATKFAIHQGDCVYATGKIANIDSIPVMGITPTLLKQCPAVGGAPAG